MLPLDELALGVIATQKHHLPVLTKKEFRSRKMILMKKFSFFSIRGRTCITSVPLRCSFSTGVGLVTTEGLVAERRTDVNRGLMVVELSFKKVVDSGNVQLLYSLILRAIVKHFYPAMQH